MHDYFLTKLLRIQGWYAKGKEIIEENGIWQAYGYRDKGHMELKCLSVGVFEPWSFFSNSS